MSARPLARRSTSARARLHGVSVVYGVPSPLSSLVGHHPGGSCSRSLGSHSALGLCSSTNQAWARASSRRTSGPLLAILSERVSPSGPRFADSRHGLAGWQYSPRRASNRRRGARGLAIERRPRPPKSRRPYRPKVRAGRFSIFIDTSGWRKRQPLSRLQLPSGPCRDRRLQQVVAHRIERLAYRP